MVSIIIPYKEDRGWLRDAIVSAENQTMKCEVIVQQGDFNKGVNINEALLRANGDWIKILDEDDLLPETAIEDLYNGTKGFDWVCGDAENFGILNNGWEDSPFWYGYIPTLKEMLEINCIHGGTTLYSLKMLIEVGGWDESLWTAEEYDLHLKLMKSGYKLGYVPKIVYRYRIHGGNKSMNMSIVNRAKRKIYIKNTIISRYGIL